MQIVGFNHDVKSDGSGKAGITFIFKDAIAKHDMNPSDTTSGGWKDSQMRSWLATEGMSMLPSDLQSKIIAVDKVTLGEGIFSEELKKQKIQEAIDKARNKGEEYSAQDMELNARLGGWGLYRAPSTTTSDKLWLFSRDEICPPPLETVELSGSFNFKESYIYETYNLFQDVIRIRDNGVLVKWCYGEPCYWWLRTPDFGNRFFDITPGGCASSDGAPTDLNGVVPGFCI